MQYYITNKLFQRYDYVKNYAWNIKYFYFYT